MTPPFQLLIGSGCQQGPSEELLTVAVPATPRRFMGDDQVCLTSGQIIKTEQHLATKKKQNSVLWKQEPPKRLTPSAS